MATIRALTEADWDDWQALWSGYLAFYRAGLSEDTTRATFQRLCGGGGGGGEGEGEGEGMFGLLGLDVEGRGIGMAHCVIHATTWSRQPTCYLEDLFVAPAARGGDLGRALLAAVKEQAAARGAGRVYWHTQEFNGRARSLYDQVGRLTSFVVYEA
ncbi:MAG TPA: GNAT family N-acetyltransferase [Acidimicrobiales bacterium]|nr:GNAT family N-acetyltransferase [Acidimicrobiales bacterium]